MGLELFPCPLFPCPFCGGTPYYYTGCNYNFVIECRNCYAQIEGAGHTLSELAALWQRRTADYSRAHLIHHLAEEFCFQTKENHFAVFIGVLSKLSQRDFFTALKYGPSQILAMRQPWNVNDDQTI